MIEIYEKNNTNYDSNGDMTLFPLSCVVEAVLNGEWELELDHSIDEDGRWKYIMPDAVVCCPTFVSDRQLFRIYETIKNDDSITAHARPIFFDSRNTLLIDTRPTDKSGQEALNIILFGTPFTGSSDITNHNTAYFVRTNIMNAIAGDDENSFLNRWGGEILFDNYTVKINRKIGGDYGVRAEFGHNLESIEENINYDNLTTRIVPVAYNGYMLDGDDPWIDSPNISKYANIYMHEVKFEDVKLKEDAGEGEEGYADLEQLRAALIEKCQKMFKNGCDLPAVNYKVNMIQLSDTVEYAGYKILECVGLGDTIHCRHAGINIDVTARVIRVSYDCIEKKNEEVELGNLQDDYFSRISDVTSKVSQKVDGVIDGNGSVMADKIAGIIDATKAKLQAQKDIATQQDVRAILFEDLDRNSPTYGAMCLGTMGFQIANVRTEDNRDWKWRTFGTGEGFAADLIVVGKMLFDRISGGTLTLGGNGNGNGVLHLLDGNGNIIAEMDVTGLKILKGLIQGVQINIADNFIVGADGTTTLKKAIITGGELNMVSENAVSPKIEITSALDEKIFTKVYAHFISLGARVPSGSSVEYYEAHLSGDSIYVGVNNGDGTSTIKAGLMGRGVVTAQEGFECGGISGIDGSFTTADGSQVTVNGGIITRIR